MLRVLSPPPLPTKNEKSWCIVRVWNVVVKSWFCKNNTTHTYRPIVFNKAREKKYDNGFSTKKWKLSKCGEKSTKTEYYSPQVAQKIYISSVKCVYFSRMFGRGFSQPLCVSTCLGLWRRRHGLPGPCSPPFVLAPHAFPTLWASKSRIILQRYSRRSFRPLFFELRPSSHMLRHQEDRSYYVVSVFGHRVLTRHWRLSYGGHSPNP